jgi:DNA replication protein DnaC
MTTTNDLESWHRANDAYLSAAVEWLRLLLAHHAAGAAPPPVVVREERATPRPAATNGRTEVRPPKPKRPWWTFGRSGATQPNDQPLFAPSRPPLALPPSSIDVTREQVDAAAARMHAAEASDPPPAMTILKHRLQLTDFEYELLLLCVAMELDTRVGALCARVHDDASLAFPTFGLGFTIFDDAGEAHWDARSPERPLRYWRLIEVDQPPSHPLTASALRADERVVNHAKGLGHRDDRLSPFITPFSDATEHEDLPPSQSAVVDEMLAALQRDQPRFRPLQLLGRDSDSKDHVVRSAAHRLGVAVHRLPATLLPSQPADLETIARLWQREALLSPVALYIDTRDVDRNAEAHAAPLKRFLARNGGIVFVDARESWPVPQGSHSFDVNKPLPSEQRALWHAALGEEHADEAHRMAAQFNVSAGTIARVVEESSNEESDEPLAARVWSRASHHTRMQIDALAQRIDAKATWSDIVLPPSELVLLHQIAAHVAGRGTVYDDWGFRERMNRGFGISALFAGESGTGKTMAAEVIANELDLALHRIDLSSVVSKWVGETEKNLQQLFNAADDSNGILFFDEADALFGKRTEVQQSQDRFANIEINFLLQRLESYRGLAILATNMKSALDTGFLRRLRFIVQFPFPGPAERRAIWKNAFPEQTPVDVLDLDRLATLPIAGGSVHNIALDAAFIAAQRNTKVSMPIVLEAAKTEMRKLGKQANEADFRWNEEERKPRVLEMKRS